MGFLLPIGLQPDIRQVPECPDEPDHQNEYQQHIDHCFYAGVHRYDRINNPKEKAENYQYNNKGDEE